MKSEREPIELTAFRFKRDLLLSHKWYFTIMIYNTSYYPNEMKRIFDLKKKNV